MGHVMEIPNPDDRLLEKILCRENLLSAWKRVKENDGAPGIDGMTIEEFPAFARNHWHEIFESLMAETYQPSPVRRVEVPKPTGGLRPLDPTGHCSGLGTDLRSDVFGIKFWLPTRPVCP